MKWPQRSTAAESSRAQQQQQQQLAAPPVKPPPLQLQTAFKIYGIKIVSVKTVRGPRVMMNGSDVSH